MPTSKHRPKPNRTRRQLREREELMDKQASARRAIYDRALPEGQQYPPFILGELMKQAAVQKMIKEMPPAYVPGQTVRLSRDRTYKVQRDGSWRRT